MNVYQPCQVHDVHRPTPLRTVTHHIQPLAMGGASVPENEVDVCDTGHFNIHRLLDALIHNDGVIKINGGSRIERRLAKQGYNAWVAAGKPGHPVFQDHFGAP